MKWNYEEFKAYLLLEASHGDLVFSPVEQAIIQKELSKETFSNIYEEFSNDTDYERIGKISEAAKFYCDTAEKKQELIESVQEIFEADGVFDQMEKNLLMFLKKLV